METMFTSEELAEAGRLFEGKYTPEQIVSYGKTIYVANQEGEPGGRLFVIDALLHVKLVLQQRCSQSMEGV